MTVLTIVLACASVLGGGLVAFLAWRDVHPVPPARGDAGSLALLLAARYRPREPEPERPQPFEWSAPTDPVRPAAASTGLEVAAKLVELLGATSLDDYARRPERREQVRTELAKLLAARS